MSRNRNGPLSGSGPWSGSIQPLALDLGPYTIWPLSGSIHPLALVRVHTSSGPWSWDTTSLTLIMNRWLLMKVTDTQLL